MELSSHVRSSSERNIACGFSGIPSLTRRVSAVTEGRDYRDHTSSKRVSLEDYITLPPSLQRFVVNSSNNRLVSSQLKTALRLVAHDLANVVVHDNNLILRSNQSQSKSPINHHFDVIFSPDSTQQQICSSCLPDLLQSYFNGSDASLLYFGAASKGNYC
ncbi:hypothetical protein AB6A40_009597 [Gnathostoma spinigerum]|uniref:Kinesin motor domain-containing protein n=1 Tax=Gnathostoma spinigerum TaxID=75299 RepID=A0ABD6F076_9BILA